MLWHGARIMALGMWGFSLLGYVGYFIYYPHYFSFSYQKLIIVAPIVACVPAIGGLILALCAGDAVIFTADASEK